ncbi:putative xanthine dehydrogenase/oxidase [Apostichopus japonicus]|uniref:Putative xanthine dehydrogenase/oxidase n=1 Tax=Stichopus japonicus TaxID=307972 RepID=A0A2G8KCA8_STIJA|nr:putative xanthine dehydrogenase/oxidase [Apostichopus japonicus]
MSGLKMGETKAESEVLLFYCNGKKILEPDPDPRMTLNTYLRCKLSLPGTKKAAKKEAVVLVLQCCHTMMSKTRRLGFVMSMYALLRNSPQPTMEQVEAALLGNICRCTGYRPILEGFKTFTKKCCGGTNQGDCCQANQLSSEEENLGLTNKLFRTQDWQTYDPTQDVIFPPELQLLAEEGTKGVQLSGHEAIWFRPNSLQALELYTLANFNEVKEGKEKKKEKRRKGWSRKYGKKTGRERGTVTKLFEFVKQTADITSYQ